MQEDPNQDHLDPPDYSNVVSLFWYRRNKKPKAPKLTTDEKIKLAFKKQNEKLSDKPRTV